MKQSTIPTSNNDAVSKHTSQIRQFAGCDLRGCFLDLWMQGGLVVGVHRLAGGAMQIQTPMDPTEYDWENAAAIRLVVLIQQIHQAVGRG